MGSMLRKGPRAAGSARATRSRGLLAGLIGGLAGTAVMDLFGAGLFLLMGAPASLAFSIIGDAAAAFAATPGLLIPGGAPLGALLHYLIGLGLGALFGLAATRAAVLRPGSSLKAVALGVLFVEIASQPLLAAAALALRMTAAEAAQWFGISAVMHLVYGLVLGLVVFTGARPDTAAPG